MIIVNYIRKHFQLVFTWKPAYLSINEVAIDSTSKIRLYNRNGVAQIAYVNRRKYDEEIIAYVDAKR